MKKLNYLIALARIGHFGRAAEACHISQPAFSSAIQNLEEELGVTLVLRGQRFMGLTPAGERILQRAQRLAADWESLKQEAATSAGQLSGSLRVGVIPTGVAVSPLLTEACLSDYPCMGFKLYSLSAELIISKLDAFELDFGLTYLEDPRLQGFNVLPLYREN
ncbi:LysR family transcriptional regulator [Methylicorpusculum oleiharenae]|uniref:LysR family transcriptional regulator n=1 Tax=Methylicorpusculum oleiharenae TaxID=1338687 RepID=UPI001E2D4AB5|nr:LysR family transcriptional regulator [Methylicorpusculum oleiharenae]MCD2451480.1 LysR family transcriptional regulator [Methylicorpusculum oleiharenae]